MEGLDPLVLTATASPDPGAAPQASAVPAAIGRFRIERQLGAGAMGVVYAAFDPDLERRIAVKVLRAAPGDVARNRLLREARAMARLSHPNVVTVHEVGTSGDRDYVATELISGLNLAEWLRAAPRSKREIVDAFLAAGRGLTAAHEAGLVHRDFKPHNVLRSDEGRIVVTDFGLARDSQGDEGSAPIPVLHGVGIDPGSLASDLTRTGALVGTPGYMAPEQWEGLEVDAAADQFSFCVALWEALAGQRPFLGQTIEELRAQVQRPPAVSDAADKIPRALRNILLRGLAPRPADRYPTMRALIETIEAARRRPRRIIAAAVVAALALIIAAAMVYASRRGATPLDSCAPPALRPEQVWTAAQRAQMPPRLAEQLDQRMAQWTAQREVACSSDSSELRRLRATCLDGVMSTLDVTIKALLRVDESVRVSNDLVELAAFPSACMQPTVPTLRVMAADRLTPAAALLLRSMVDDKIPDQELEAAVTAARDGCERAQALYIKAVAHMTKTSFGRDAAAAEDAIEACGDDYLRARIAVLRASRTETFFYGTEQLALLRKATAAVDRVADTSMLSQLDQVRGRAAYTNNAFDTALEHFQRSQLLAQQGGDSRTMFWSQWSALSALSSRGRPKDLATLTEAGRELNARMAEMYGAKSANLRPYRAALAGLEWRAGNLVRARELLAESLRDLPESKPAGRVITGRVLDERGKPLPGALVLAVSVDRSAEVDDVDLALWDRKALEDVGRAVTAQDGTFSLPTVAGDVFVLARTTNRAAPVARVAKGTSELALRAGPSGTVHGVIDFATGTQFSTRASAGTGRMGFHFVAPVAQSGHYEVANVPTGWYSIRALNGRVSEVSASAKRVRVDAGRRKAPVNFGAAQREGRLHVIVRNEREGSLNVGQVYVIRGRVNATTVRELRPILDASSSYNVALARQVVGERAPQAVRSELRPGDLMVTVEHLEMGQQTVCVVGLSGDLGAEEYFEKLQGTAERLDVRCRPVVLDKGQEPTLLVQVPPMLRVE